MPLHTYLRIESRIKNLDNFKHISKDVEYQGNSCFLLVRVRNGIVTLEDCLAISCNIELIPIRSYSNHAFWYLYKGPENLVTQKPT